MWTDRHSKGCDSKELFENFKIAGDSSFKEHLNKYNVIHLNIQQFLGRTETIHEMLELLSRKVTRELKREFADVMYYEEDLVSVIEEIYAQTHSFFVFIIDEWDCIFRVKGEDTEAQKVYLNFLRDLLKNQPYCILAYMTGILPIKKYGEHSALNMFDEYSMTNQRELAEFTGFTEQEVQKEFINCIEDGGWEPVMDAIRKSEELLAATICGEEETVARMIENAHQENTSILAYNDENSLACVIALAYYSAKKNYVVYRELAGGKGFADMVFVPRKTTQTPAIVVELKWNQTAEAAITQIKRKQYVESLKDYRGEVILVGISYLLNLQLSCAMRLVAVMILSGIFTKDIKVFGIRVYSCFSGFVCLLQDSIINQNGDCF